MVFNNNMKGNQLVAKKNVRLVLKNAKKKIIMDNNIYMRVRVDIILEECVE